MRRPTKFIHPDPIPGSTRIKRTFAWRPKVIVDTIIWLEYFETWQAFVYFEYSVIFEGKQKLVKTGEWKDLENRLIVK
jgi:hypothetical protein